MRERLRFDGVDQTARRPARRNQVIPASRREVSALAADGGHVQRDRIDAAKIVEQPAVQLFGSERILNSCDIQCGRWGREHFLSIIDQTGHASARGTFSRAGRERTMTRATKYAALIALLAGVTLAGQQAPPTTLPQTPTFKVQVDYVDVDVLVTDQQGKFVRELSKDDFQVFEDGKRQSIANFSVVDIPVERFDRPLYSPEPFEPDVETNEPPFQGRVYVMILDDMHVDVMRSTNVKNAAKQFIQRNLGANDVMAIVHAGGRTEAAQEFTRNKRLLLASVDKFMGRKLLSSTLARSEVYYRQQALGVTDRVLDPLEQERAYNAQQTMRLLQDVAEWFGSVRGRRKTIIFVSEGIDYDIYDVIRSYDQPSSFASGVL